MEQTTAIERYSKEFLDKVKTFKKDWYNSYKKIGKEETPRVDGTGKKIIDKKGNYDYIVVAYMVECLDKHFPGWSWEMAAPIQFLGSEWVVAQGTLSIIDEHLIAFSFNPPIRKFYGCNAARIMYGTGKTHTVENIIDIGNNVKAANTEAMKVAINRLTHIGDDVYGKRIEEEGAGSYEDTLATSAGASSFGELLKQNRILWGEALQILGVSSPGEITDFTKAWDKIKEAKGIE
ncbi:hypothetical protein ES704_01953 [subsurface metagenome]|jgi:hypothetical protein